MAERSSRIARIKTSNLALLRLLCATYWSIKFSVMSRSVRLVYRRKDGLVVNRQANLTFCSFEPNSTTATDIERLALDNWVGGLELERGAVVVDVGAGIGEDALVFSRLVGTSGKVFAVEAHPRTYQCLEATIRCNRNLTRNITPVNLALSSYCGLAKMASGESYLSNALASEGVAVRVSTLNAFFDQYQISRVDLLKVNIEGAEWPLLEQADLSRVVNISISCHDFIDGVEEMQTYDRVRAKVLAAGFSLLPRRQHANPWIKFLLYGYRANPPSLNHEN
ncbi:MAG: FkbM family methyltransferase [Pseudomonadota bacterium]